jgi:anaerobic magnesium-protoporphyrin IX monomethyl ester cyclase
MEYFSAKFDLNEFHIEDLNPTISDKRTREICEEIIDRQLNIIWKISAGTKVETIRSEETIDLMAQAGCRYISISPETGSQRLLKQMRKPFKVNHALRLVKRMNEVGIRCQACFVLGFPGETDDDRLQTWDLVFNLTRQGIDEIALFIITPVPGSGIYSQFSGYQSLSQLNFSPTWREDYEFLAHFRMRLYRNFLLWKMRYQTFKLLRQPFNFLFRNFETKMEMVPYRALKLKWLSLRTVWR